MWMWSTGINRNIVECKAGREPGAGLDTGSINRNIVECKEGLNSYIFLIYFGINRNIVECKVKSGDFSEVEKIVLIETLWNVKIIRKLK